MVEINENVERVALVVEIVAAYISNNAMEVSELPDFIKLVYQSLYNLESVSPFLTKRGKPAVPIEESVTPDYLVCLEDGKHLKMLKRHLKTAYNMTPEQYRERWNLPSNYPMVAPNYAKKRRHIAKTSGLGTHRKVQKKKKAA